MSLFYIFAMGSQHKRSFKQNNIFAVSINDELLQNILKKSELKDLKINGSSDFVNNDKAMKNERAWKQSLSHQLSIIDLPDFKTIYKELTMFLEIIFDEPFKHKQSTLK